MNRPGKRWTPENVARLGNELDRVIGSSLGVTRAAVCIKRRSLGIPQVAKPRPHWTRAMIARLGKMPDAKVAATYGLTYRAVARKRSGLGIPGFGK